MHLLKYCSISLHIVNHQKLFSTKIWVHMMPGLPLLLSLFLVHMFYPLDLLVAWGHHVGLDGPPPLFPTGW